MEHNFLLNHVHSMNTICCPPVISWFPISDLSTMSHHPGRSPNCSHAAIEDIFHLPSVKQIMKLRRQ